MDKISEIAYVGLGSNLGSARDNVTNAILCLDQIATTKVMSRSYLYQSQPIGMPGNDVINAVVKITTELTPEKLMAELLAIENRFGRQRTEEKTARTLDLDLLFFADIKMNTPFLTLPHPRWQDRAFVLLPLLDLQFGDINPIMLQRVARQAIFRLPDDAISMR